MKTGGEDRQARHAWNEIIVAPEQFEASCDEYVDYCIASHRRPTWHGLTVALGVSDRTLRRWYESQDERHMRHSAVLKRTVARMADLLQQDNTTMAIAILNQWPFGFSREGGVGNTVEPAINVIIGGKTGPKGPRKTANSTK